MTNGELIKKAAQLENPVVLSGQTIAAEVGSALITDKGNVYVGVSLHASCGIGACGEHTAIGNMLTNKETRIKRIVAVGGHGKIFPPCGRCRELMYQVNPANSETEVILGEDRVAKLKDLLPEHWYSQAGF